MAIFTYGANNISFGTFNTWANNVSVQANTSLSSSLSDFHPANAAPFQVSEIAPSTVVFYGFVQGAIGGNVSLTSPYTVTSTASFYVKNLLLTTYSVTLVALPTYPSVFDSWRTETGGAGTVILTSAKLTITNGSSTTLKDPTEYHAWFV